MEKYDWIKYVKSDIYRYYGTVNYKIILKSLFNRTLRFQIILRMANNKSTMNVLGRVLYKLSKTKRIIQIHYNTLIGYGLYIGHGGPVIINPSSIIGNNVNLSQFLTIGSNHNKAAKIGDNVYIGPNVCIVEDVEIGNNVTIGAGSVVTKSIPNNATIVGNYAKIINYNNPGRYIKNKWRG